MGQAPAQPRACPVCHRSGAECRCGESDTFDSAAQQSAEARQLHKGYRAWLQCRIAYEAGDFGDLHLIGWDEVLGQMKHTVIDAQEKAAKAYEEAHRDADLIHSR